MFENRRVWNYLNRNIAIPPRWFELL